MPTNKYKCSNCNEEWTFIGPFSDKECPTCKTITKPLLPRNINTPSVFETVDSDHSVKRRDNFDERAKKRNAAGSKKTAKEIARIHGNDPQKHGYTEDDPKLI